MGHHGNKEIWIRWWGRTQENIQGDNTDMIQHYCANAENNEKKHMSLIFNDVNSKKAQQIVESVVAFLNNDAQYVQSIAITLNGGWYDKKHLTQVVDNRNAVLSLSQ